MNTLGRRVMGLARSDALLDIAIAAAALAGSGLLIRHGGLGPFGATTGQIDLLSAALAVCSTVPLVAWRRSPLGVFALTSVASVLLTGLGYRMDLLIGPAAALYLLTASRDRQTAWTGRMTATVLGLFGVYLATAAAAVERSLPGSELLHTGLAWGVSWFAGERTRLRREQISDLRTQARRAARDAERERQLAAAEERARIARDLHDSAGHAISLIAVRAGAARLRYWQDPNRSLAALEAIEEVARQTAAEIDAIVGTLRENSSADEVSEFPVGLASLDRLIESHRQAGLDIAFDSSGTPRRLGSAADQAAFRILQEALTNAARHGTGSARIELAFGEKWLELSVTNPMHASASAASVGGHGLVGMQERATLLGGTLDAGRADGLFHVRARLGYGGHAA